MIQGTIEKDVVAKSAKSSPSKGEGMPKVEASDNANAQQSIDYDLARYLSNIEPIKPLSKDEEQQAARQAKEIRSVLRSATLSSDWVQRQVYAQLKVAHDSGKNVHTLCKLDGRRSSEREKAYSKLKANIPKLARLLNSNETDCIVLFSPESSSDERKSARERLKRNRKKCPSLFEDTEIHFKHLSSIYDELQKKNLQIQTLLKELRQDGEGPVLSASLYEQKHKQLINLIFNVGESPKLLAKRMERVAGLMKSEAKHREFLVAANLKRVVKIARTFIEKDECKGIALLELIEAGNLGLIDAVCDFDPEDDMRLAAYARKYIVKFISKHIREESLHRDFREESIDGIKMSELGSIEEEFKARHAQLPSPDEVHRISLERIASDKSEIEINWKEVPDLRAMEKALSSANISHSEDFSFMQGLGTLSKDYIDSQDLLAVLRERVKDRAIDDREFSVLFQRFGLGNTEAKTLKEIGSDLGLTKERVRQIESLALDKLREHYSKKNQRCELSNEVVGVSPEAITELWEQEMRRINIFNEDPVAGKKLKEYDPLEERGSLHGMELPQYQF